jgi:hypothetical protein
MMRIRRADLLQLRQIYGFSCAYCGISEDDAGAELTVDHWQPRSAGGSDALDNLVYACHACNGFKGDYWNPDSEERLLHPLRDNVDQHIQSDTNGMLIGLTVTGAFHIAQLQLNRPALIRARQRRWSAVLEHQRLAAIEA